MLAENPTMGFLGEALPEAMARRDGLPVQNCYCTFHSKPLNYRAN